MTEALVLGGGGVAGIAWLNGLLLGLAESGRDVSAADVLIGTSAGSAVAAQLGSGLSLEELYARQVDPVLQAKEIPADLDPERMAADLGPLFAGVTSLTDLRRRIGKVALAAKTVSEPARRAVIESRLPSHDWPSRDLRVVALDAETGEPRVFDRASGVPLVDAVAASCAVPGIWPAVTIEGRRYIDGGMRSPENADYASFADRVLILAPMGTDSPFPTEKPALQLIDELRTEGKEATIVVPDEAALKAIGTNPLDPGTRVPAAEAGRAQGKELTLTWR